MSVICPVRRGQPRTVRPSPIVLAEAKATANRSWSECTWLPSTGRANDWHNTSSILSYHKHGDQWTAITAINPENGHFDDIGRKVVRISLFMPYSRNLMIIHLPQSSLVTVVRIRDPWAMPMVNLPPQCHFFINPWPNLSAIENSTSFRFILLAIEQLALRNNVVFYFSISPNTHFPYGNVHRLLRPFLAAFCGRQQGWKG